MLLAVFVVFAALPMPAWADEWRRAASQPSMALTNGPGRTQTLAIHTSPTSREAVESPSNRPTHLSASEDNTTTRTVALSHAPSSPPRSPMSAPPSTPPSSSPPELSESATPPPPATHTILVGNAPHTFSPNETKAVPGDWVEFRFFPNDNWVIRGDFDNPCVPYEYVGADRTSLSSGIQHVMEGGNSTPLFRVRVENWEPIFYYNGASDECFKGHMIGVINPVPTMMLADWLQKVEQAKFQLRPGDQWPHDSTPRLLHGSNGGVETMAAGQIAGIVIGSVATLVGASALFFWCYIRGGVKLSGRGRRRQRRLPYARASGAAPYKKAPINELPAVGLQCVGTVQVQSRPPRAYSQLQSHCATETRQQAPVELPTTSEANNSPRPSFLSSAHVQSLDVGGVTVYTTSDGFARYSWAGEESAYRPFKR